MNIWINGRASSTIDVRDRGLHYGDGLFETMRIRRRVIRLLDRHLERLQTGCERLGITAPDAERLRGELGRMASSRRDGILKLMVTRGAGRRGYRPSGRESTTRIAMTHPLSRAAILAVSTPVRIRLCAARLSENPALAGLKTLNRLDSVLARTEWTDARVWEGLMRDSDDHIVCGTMSNLFVRRGSSLITPRLDRCGVAGVMRGWVLDEARTLGLRPVEQWIRWRDLDRVDEAFATNAVLGIVPVASIEHGRLRIRLSQHGASSALSSRLECH